MLFFVCLFRHGKAALWRGRRPARGRFRQQPPKKSRNVRRIRSRHFLPPAGEGGIRRSPARMTEEGERDRQQTVKPFSYLHGCGHFHIAVPPRSPSPAALVGGTLPRWGREGVRALWMTAASGEFAAVYCRGRRPRRPAATPKTSCYIRRIRNRPIVGKGLALSAQHMARHGNALHVCGFARGRRTSGQSLPEGASCLV